VTFTAREISNTDGKPVELYMLRWGQTVWRYTSADRDIEWPAGSGNNFQAVAISDGGVKQGGSDQEDFTVTGPASLPIVDLFRSTPPSETIWLTVRKKHHGDEDAVVTYVGKVANVKRKEGRTTAEIRCIAISASYKKAGLRLTWDRNCPHILYDFSCRANKVLFKVTTTITAVDGVDITVAALGTWPEAQYRGGFVEWDSDGLGTMERRSIEASTGVKTFALLGRADRLVVGQAITLYIGCDRTTAQCDGVFDNLDNYGGYPQMPGKSPFDGTPIF
jgi:uncharacterized phage protein (TIGR02218 family)